MKTIAKAWIVVLIVSTGLAAGDEEDARSIQEEVKRIKAEYSQQISELRRELKQVKRRLQQAEQRLDAIGGITVDPSHPDGKVMRVDARSQTVWINLGTQDGIVAKERIAVYHADSGKTGRAVRKGMIEVFRMLDKHLAEARILESQIKNPLLPGDVVVRVKAAEAGAKAAGEHRKPKDAFRERQPKIDGVVTAIADRHVEISVGADDGVKKGFQFEVFRNRTFVCRIVIVKASPDASVGKVIKETLKAPIKIGDRITSRL